MTIFLSVCSLTFLSIWLLISLFLNPFPFSSINSCTFPIHHLFALRKKTFSFSTYSKAIRRMSSIREWWFWIFFQTRWKRSPFSCPRRNFEDLLGFFRVSRWSICCTSQTRTDFSHPEKSSICVSTTFRFGTGWTLFGAFPLKSCWLWLQFIILSYRSSYFLFIIRKRLCGILGGDQFLPVANILIIFICLLYL